MKKRFLLISICAFSLSLYAQNDLLIYGNGVTGVTWSNFAGPTDVQEVANPSTDGVNSTATCIRMNRPKITGNSDDIGWPWEGAISSNFNVANISDYNSITMLVKKPYPGKVCLELLGPTGGSSMIYAEYTATDNSWQELTFPVINVAGIGGLATILLEIHRENENNNSNFDDCYMYADEITLHKTMPPFYFNGEDKIAGGWIPFPSDEFSYLAKIVDNPDKTGINTTSKCLWIERQKSDPLYSGAINRCFKVTNLNNYKSFTMMVKKSIAGPVSLEIQSPGEAQKQVLTASYTDAGNWQQLVFPIPDNALNGQPLQIIILQAHAVDTSNDNSFTGPIDIYVDELYLSDTTTAVPSVLNNKYKIVHTDIYNMDGQIIKKLDADISDIKYLQKGMYLLRQIDEVGNITSRKIINN